MSSRVVVTQLSEVMRAIASTGPTRNLVRVLLTGPCGVGKTAMARLLSSETEGIVHIELDRIKESVRVHPSPCSLKYLNLDECLSLILDNSSSSFILDIGGDSIFRSGVDNEDRLRQVQQAKVKYGMAVVVLKAEKDVLLARFTSSKNRTAGEFADVWYNWRSIEEPYWDRCADCIIDTTSLRLPAG